MPSTCGLLYDLVMGSALQTLLLANLLMSGRLEEDEALGAGGMVCGFFEAIGCNHTNIEKTMHSLVLFLLFANCHLSTPKRSPGRASSHAHPTSSPHVAGFRVYSSGRQLVHKNLEPKSEAPREEPKTCHMYAAT